jgi:hypothetical protein
MLRWIVYFVVNFTLRVVQNLAVSHITVVELELNHADVTNRAIIDIFKRISPHSSRPNVTYAIPVAVNFSYCTPDDGYGKYPKHVE